MNRITVADVLNVVDLMNTAAPEPVHCQMDDYVVMKGYDCEGRDRGTVVEALLESSFGDPLEALMRKEEQQGKPIAFCYESTQSWADRHGGEEHPDRGGPSW